MSNSTVSLLTVRQMAESLGVSEACIRRWVLERKLATIKVGRLIRIPVSELERLLGSVRPARPAR